MGSREREKWHHTRWNPRAGCQRLYVPCAQARVIGTLDVFSCTCIYVCSRRSRTRRALWPRVPRTLLYIASTRVRPVT